MLPNIVPGDILNWKPWNRVTLATNRVLQIRVGAHGREELLEDVVLCCSGLLGSRPFSFISDCKHCITVLDSRLSSALVLGLADALSSFFV